MKRLYNFPRWERSNAGGSDVLGRAEKDNNLSRRSWQAIGERVKCLSSPSRVLGGEIEKQNQVSKPQVRLGTYGSVLLHPKINELAECIGPLEETWLQLRPTRNNTKNLRKVSFVSLHHHFYQN